jgi:hypothetical protein
MDALRVARSLESQDSVLFMRRPYGIRPFLRARALGEHAK